MSGTSEHIKPEDEYAREEVVCNICGIKDERFLFNIPERVVQCWRCGLIYLNPRLDSESLKKVYNKEYFVAKSDDYGVDYPAYANYIGDEPVIMRSMHLRMKRVEKFARQKGRVLDVGCAAGFSLLAAQQRGWAAEGIEISEFCVDYARSRNLKVHLGCLEDYSGESQSFDAVTMWDYLEHSSDPLKELKICASLLKKGGVLVCSIPNVDSWSYRFFKEKWIGFKNVEHFYFYSRSTLAQIARLAGLQTERSYYLGKHLSLSFFLSRVQYYTSLKAILIPVEKFANTKLAKSVYFYLNPFDILNVVLRK
jgi:2-polyprenyl-3-methyl-5-hydroxy-6-metoxy-1,4-benzoquinol methylase